MSMWGKLCGRNHAIDFVPPSAHIRNVRLIACFALICCSLALSQQVSTKPTFEAATVRPADPNPANAIFVGMSADPSIVRYRNLTLRDAIRGAYKVRDFQIVGPDWLASARFEIDARLPAGVNSDQIPEMLQTLLEERFKLTFRRDPKEMQVYALLTGKDGPKLKRAEVKTDNVPTAMGTDGKPRAAVSFGGSASSITINAPSSSILTLVGVVSRFTGRPVVDETGVDGLYDFRLTFAPEVTTSLPGAAESAGAAADPSPSLADAVKQYGLRVESRKARIDMFVVTHIERTPTEN